MGDYYLKRYKGIELGYRNWRTKDEYQLIFKLRGRVTALKIDQKNSHESYECVACKIEDESQEHVLECVKIIEMQKDDDKEGDKPA